MIWYINLQISKIIFSHSFYFNYYLFTFREMGSAWIALILVPSCSANFSGYKTVWALFFPTKALFWDTLMFNVAEILHTTQMTVGKIIQLFQVQDPLDYSVVYRYLRCCDMKWLYLHPNHSPFTFHSILRPAHCEWAVRLTPFRRCLSAEAWLDSDGQKGDGMH